MEGFRRAGTLGPLLAPNRCKLNMKLVELFMGHIYKAFSAKKILTGWQGGSIEVRIPRRDFRAPAL